MKKTRTALLLVLAGTVTFTVGLWLYSTMDKLGTFEFAAAGSVLVVVLFSMIVGIRRIKDEKKGIAPEDELSRRIKQKAAASAFSLSFILWTMIALFTVDSELRVEIPIGMGILGMGLLFVGFWIYYSISGIKDENAN